VRHVDCRSPARRFPEDTTARLAVVAANLVSDRPVGDAATCEEIFDPQTRLDAAHARLQTSMADVGRASQIRVIEELTASIVHEIGQPLSAITAAAAAALHWLSHPAPNVGEALDVVSHIRLSAERARSIVQGLRALTRKTRPRFLPVDLGEALRESVSLVGASLERLGVTLEVDGPEQPVLVRGDLVQLQQLACNLLMNGAEAMETKPRSERRLSLSWRAAEPAHASIVIQDRGLGFDVSSLDRLVEPFYTTKPHGMGMGLAICKSILDAHDATMAFSPGAGGGTVVRLRIARIASQEQARDHEVGPPRLTGPLQQ
jgi:C4-dicarboxylate-specific signal transduction histidine kinase